jgi:hypothetical protein
MTCTVGIEVAGNEQSSSFMHAFLSPGFNRSSQFELGKFAESLHTTFRVI